MSTAPAFRVAIVGAGPAGLYAAAQLLERRDLNIEIDLFERLATPWGLVRAGVAPDHPEKKLVIDRQFDFYLRNARVRFIGNVEIGHAISHAEIVEWYGAVVYAVGATGDNRMGIPGEELPGCWSAREFVGFYNGHPDYAHLKFDLSCDRAVVVGNGNVALDVARILTAPVRTLEKTDIADHALDALRASAVKEVVVLGRRGQFQAAFNNPELEELEHLHEVDIVVESGEPPDRSEVVLRDLDWQTQRKIETLNRIRSRPPGNRPKRIVLRFLTSPLEILGTEKVQRLLTMRNALVRGRDGLHAQAAGREEFLDTGLIFRAIGYRGLPFPGLPFDDRRGVIRNCEGRVMDDGGVRAGVYVTGWIKRGCRGIIGSNKKCASETIGHLFEDWDAGRLTQKGLTKDAVLSRIEARGASVVDLGGWLAVDHAERESGRAQGRPRRKITDRDMQLACAFSEP
ncbi:MAG: FAD-dependent oxidoreductase [Rhizomicrobium sp.]